MLSANPQDIIGKWKLFKFSSCNVDTFFGDTDNWVEWTLKEDGTALYRFQHNGTVITDSMPRFWKMEGGEIWLYARKKRMFKVVSANDGVLALKLAKADMVSFCRKMPD